MENAANMCTGQCPDSETHTLFSSYLAFVFVFVFVFAFVSVFVFWFALSVADVCTVQFSDSQTPHPFLSNGSFESLSFFAFWSWETDSNIGMSSV